jgi:UDP-N-acetylglucosamine 2-epimerase (non-hydrolysing)
VTKLVAELAPDMVLVQGDTTTAWAAALAAHAAGVAVGHVEAGLRSHDPLLPWPEERNRVAIDAISTLLFAPTGQSRANLLAEPAVTGRIHVTGNSGIDALMWMHARTDVLPTPGERLILVTCHRRENIGAPIARVAAALAVLAERTDVRIVLPMHDNPSVRAGIVAALGGVAGVELIEPLPYPEMVALLARAHIVLSDSGGLQEEAPALGVPLLVLRDNTERPEALASGNIALVGTDPAAIVAAATRLLDDPEASSRRVAAATIPRRMPRWRPRTFPTVKAVPPNACSMRSRIGRGAASSGAVHRATRSAECLLSRPATPNSAGRKDHHDHGD